MNDITIAMDAAEALIALGAIQDKALDASRLAAISTGEEHEIADLSARLLQRVAGRITDALYPPRDLADPVRRHILEQEVELGMY